MRGIRQGSQEKLHGTSEANSHLSQVRKLRLLIVDDETELAELLQSNLEAHGFHVSVCNGGEVALEQIDKSLFDCLITDQKMPGMSGTELIHKSKTLKNGRHLRCILMSGALQGDDSFLVDGLELFGRIHKPFSTQNILDILDRDVSALKKTG